MEEGGREGGSLLMGFDGRQSYERVATQSERRERRMIFALISYSAIVQQLFANFIMKL